MAKGCKFRHKRLHDKIETKIRSLQRGFSPQLANSALEIRGRHSPAIALALISLAPNMGQGLQLM